MVALPTPVAVAAKVPLVEPAGIVMEAGTVATAVLLELRVTVVGVPCAALSVTVKVLLPPTGALAVAGVSVTVTVTTLTVALAAAPSGGVAVTVALPAVTPFTVKVALVEPAGIDTDAAPRVIEPVPLVAERLTVVAAVGAALRVTVMVVEPPTETLAGFGVTV